jgi:hypothetical protein
MPLPGLSKAPTHSFPHNNLGISPING